MALDSRGMSAHSTLRGKDTTFQDQACQMSEQALCHLPSIHAHMQAGCPGGDSGCAVRGGAVALDELQWGTIAG